jgi:hypothetical protein
MLNYAIGIAAALIVALFLFGKSCNGKGPEAGFLGIAAYLLLLPLFLVFCVLIALKF